MTYNYRQIWNALLIIAFATIGISPACHFISGDKNFIEICTTDGEIKKITLAEAGLSADADQNQPQHQTKQPDCLFCIASASAKLTTTSTTLSTAMPGANYIGNGRGSFVPKAYKAASFDARGSPAITA